MSDFATWMRAQGARTEAALEAALPSTDTIPYTLHEAMRYAVLGGGKRVRPLLVHAAGEVVGATPEACDAAACAVEMIHAYSLVHDDMPCMDDDDLRRGRPTVHKAYDEATALLVGDALQSQAFIVLAQTPALAAEARLKVVAELAVASGSIGMCGGQAIDLQNVGKAMTREALEGMHRMKTGALLRASVRMGALCGNIDQAGLVALDRYAAAVGLAFQVVDDILDVTADTATLGKTAGKDAANDKPTYVSLLGLDAARELAAQLRTDAHEALEGFGTRAGRLAELADLIVLRSN
ncbi:farnesyl diphosphate synthase [Cupriavidus metallidurans]|jgi:farnesyl diphosphate synthase|uniref:Geranyltranstransferase n=1 Tax=Cupriavidus metallidurans (strain ATCC 43123 / DSM 2839 / NBRC 102507 / CH34) TaxID=266264 RepID=Q1LK33_CUPMC|nr:farnesyl diphosphate synthase [Cupriavidus metallidurans]ABF09493.1 geranyltranstransferase [Cupriavidus metallidurans CH34]AVA36674.1 geranyl transferase [Cupriavidus metallidurans]KWW37342.1 Farnesyl diphosphate synthase [Cupriavidus metallidurans]MDE4919003.1 polyprenyl synthetase family protein [Cupriavidus metallidurans]QGS29646.1 geranyl transferase [Cupriavidus metallidurans]